MLTREDNYYFILSDNAPQSNQNADNLYDLFQQNSYVNVQRISDLSELANYEFPDNAYHIRFIFFSDMGNLDSNSIKSQLINQKLDSQIIDQLTITSNPNSDFGTIEQLIIKSNSKSQNINSQQTQSFYLDHATLLAAIFSHDLQQYECNLQKAFFQYNLLAQIYANKAAALATTYQQCKNFHYNLLSQTINTLSNSMQISNLNPNVNPQSLATQATKKNEIDNLNEQLLLAPGGSCPRLY